MSTQTLNVPLRNDTDALYREWGSALSAAIAAFGWTKAADPGQVNWTTVVRPAGNASLWPFELWQMADTLASTAPIVLRLEYGTAQHNATTPALRFTFATATTGAGDLIARRSPTLYTGLYYASSSPPATNWNPDTTPVPTRLSGAADRLLALFYSTATGTNHSLFFAIERTRDATGAPTPDGVVLFALGSYNINTYPLFLFFPSVGPTRAIEQTQWPIVMPTATASAVDGLTVHLFPCTPVTPRQLPPIRSFVACFSADVPAETSFTADIFGSPQQFYQPSHPLLQNRAARGASPNYIAFRWD